MSKCLNSDNGLHVFKFFSGSEEEPIIKEYMTCIACGERRAIGVLGDLLVRKDGNWVKLEPTNKEDGLL